MNPLPDPNDFVYDALDSGNIEEGRRQLDQWQTQQTVSVQTLSQLRFYRNLLGQPLKAIAAATEIIQLRMEGSWESMSDHLRLGELCLQVEEFDQAWASLTQVLQWPELKEWYPAGLARSAVQLALDLSAAKNCEEDLRQRAFESAIRLFDDGCSSSLVILEQARDCAASFGRQDLSKRFSRAVVQEQSRIQQQLNRET